MRMYGIRSGRNNMTNLLARSYIRNSKNNNDSGKISLWVMAIIVLIIIGL